MRSPDRQSKGGPAATLNPQRTTTDTTARSQFVASITRLDDCRPRRLLAPWPGWWGGAEVHSWTWAERSRRSA